jgi:hypothetical protein
MPRIKYVITYVATVGWLVAATTHVNAQQPTGSAPPPRPTTARATPARVAPPKILPGTHPHVFSSIQGNALSSANAPLNNAIIRLRDARVGRIVETQVSDQAGLFSFPTIDPGSYIVEIMGQDESSVLAASQILYVGSGEAVSAVVKLPFKIPAFGVLGNSRSPLLAMATQAASAGVMATRPSGAETCITLQP